MNPNDNQQDQWPDDPLLDSVNSQGTPQSSSSDDLRDVIEEIVQGTDEILDILRDGQQQPIPRPPQPQQRRKRSVNSVIDQIVDQVSSQVTQDIAAAQPDTPPVADQGMPRAQRQRDARGRWISNTPPSVADQQTTTPTAGAANADPSSVGQTDTPPVADTEPNSQGRRRDANGRWLPSDQPTTDITTRNQPSSAGGDSDADQVGRKGESPAYWDKFSHAVGQGMQDATQGVDPTVEALREAGVFKAVSWVFGKKDKLPKEQSKHNRIVERLLRRMAKEGNREGGGGSWMMLLRLAPLLIAGLVAGITVIGPVIAGVLGAALAVWLAGKAVELGKEAIDAANKLADSSRDPAQGDINPDGSSNTGVVGWINRGSKAVTNTVRGMANSVNAWLGGDNDYWDDGTSPDSKNRVGLKTDPINQKAGFVSGGALGELIGSGEGDYNSFNRGVAGDSRNEKIDFSNMTVGELMRRQSLTGKDRIFAAGKYQVVPDTLKEAVKLMKIDPNAKFTPELQERIFAERLVGTKRPALQAYRLGKSDDATSALYDASKEFASIAVPKGLRTATNRISDGTMTYYDNKGGNRASIMPHQVLAAMNKDREALKLSSVPKPTVTPQKQAPISQAEGKALLDQFMPNNNMALPTAPQTKVITPAIPYRPQYQPAPKLPAQPKTSQQINTPQPQAPVTSMGDDSMTQNVGDRQLAHLITGGLGMGGQIT